jgi:hypothetical protein
MTLYATKRNRAPYRWFEVSWKQLRRGALAEEYTGISLCLDADRKIVKVLRAIKRKIEEDPDYRPPRLYHIHEQRKRYAEKLAAIAQVLVRKTKRRRSGWVITWKDFVERKP